MRPRIGITTSYEDETQRLNIAYIRAIEDAGGLPLIVPILESDEAAAEFAALLDGLVITGGPGIIDGLIGALPDDLPPVDAVRAENDRRIYHAFVNKPLLGICYGMQFVNAMHGGTIYGDVTAQLKTANHSKSRGANDHLIRINPQSHLGRIMGIEEIQVNTHHIQALAQVGEGLQVSAVSPDEVVEGIESADGRFIGLQFHPERMGVVMQPLFADFVQRCKAARPAVQSSTPESV